VERLDPKPLRSLSFAGGEASSRRLGDKPRHLLTVPCAEFVVAQGMPDSLRSFMHDTCRIPRSAFHALLGASLPEPAKQLLAHAQDMTSTLATFHESPLRVEILQHRRRADYYLREVFLRTTAANTIVEYGVIAIDLDQFSPEQQEAIQAGDAPLGGLLHRFRVPFVSAPLGFFSVTGAMLAATPLSVPPETNCYGRFNRLAKATGEPIAWILEILPPAN
jgi:hypothetical protein